MNRTWDMFALAYEKGISGFYGIGDYHYTQMHGGTPIPVTVTEDPEGDMLGWIASDETVPTMIQHRRVFEIQFPYGSKVSADAGHGHVVHLRVERTTPVS